MRSALLRAAAAASDRVLWLLDADGGHLGASEGWCAFTGQSPAQATGAGWLDAIHPGDRESVRALWTAKPPPAIECRVLRPNGKHTRAQITAAAADAAFVCCLSEVWVDSAVRQSEERLRLATEAAKVAIWEYDFVAGQMTRTDNHDGLYGLAQLPVWTYDAFTDATHPDDREASNQAVQRSVAPGGPDHYAMDFRVVWPDGSVHWLACTGDVVRRDADGKATLVRGTLADVTRLKAVEAELLEAVRVRDDFLQVASHELNTPLTPLLLKLQRIERRGTAAADPELAKDLAGIRHQATRLGVLVETLLDVTRLSQGPLAFTRQRVDLVALIRGVTDTLAAHHEVPITVHGDPEVLGEWDPVRIEQVAHNLVSNAIKYGQARPVRVVVSLSGARARFEVIDEGIGIEPESLARLFQKFERAASARSYGGLGLGLFIARQLVQQHGGEVRAESTPGKGSKFSVELPLRP